MSKVVKMRAQLKHIGLQQLSSVTELERARRKAKLEYKDTLYALEDAIIKEVLDQEVITLRMEQLEYEWDALVCKHITLVEGTYAS